MARLKLILAKALVLYVALLPLFGMPVEAQGKQPIRPPLPDPVPERPVPVGQSVFTPASKTVTLRAFNGFSSDATPGLFRHEGHRHGGGMATIDSPWGEQLRIRYWLTPHGFTLEYDEDLKVRYRFDQSGSLEEIVAETAEREARMLVGQRSQLAYLGQRDFNSFDLSAYALIEESLRAKHSAAFLAGLREFDGAAEVSCSTQGIQCVACILGWAISVGAIATACVVGGVPTFGVSCFLAIAAHEVTNFACAATCIDWAEDCFGGAPSGSNGPIPDGCEP